VPAPTDCRTWGFGKGVVSSDFAVEVGHCARRALAEHLHGTWVNALSRGAASDAHASTGKTEPAFQSAESALPVLDRPKSRACAVLATCTRC
jgi:hypothetical protein